MGDDKLNNIDSENMICDSDELIIGKTVGSEDISSDQNEYTYAVVADNAISCEEITELLKNTK